MGKLEKQLCEISYHKLSHVLCEFEGLVGAAQVEADGDLEGVVEAHGRGRVEEDGHIFDERGAVGGADAEALDADVAGDGHQLRAHRRPRTLLVQPLENLLARAHKISFWCF